MELPRNEILYGNSLDLLGELPEECIHCAVTSPPYWNLRSYEGPDPTWPDGTVVKLGEEPDPQAYLDHLQAILRGVQRVLHPTGTLWLNIGDSYHKKQLLNIPWQLVLRLQEDGWLLRSTVVWNKTSRMPENVRNRPTQTWEPVFMLAKSPTYYYDEVASREIGKTANLRNVWDMSSNYRGKHDAVFPDFLPYTGISVSTSEHGCCSACSAPYVRKVLRSVHDSGREGHPTRYGDVGTKGSKGFKIPSLKPPTVSTVGWEPSCSCEGASVTPCLVLDPFSGSGTTLMEAKRLDRDYIGMDTNRATKDESDERLDHTQRMIFDFGFGLDD